MSSEVEFDEDGLGFQDPTSPKIRVNAYNGAPGSFIPAKQQAAEEVLSNKPGMEGWLMRHRFTKSPRGAQVILIGVIFMNFVIIAIVVTLFV